MVIEYFKQKSVNNYRESQKSIQEQLATLKKNDYALQFARQLKEEASMNQVRVLSSVYTKGKDAEVVIQEPSVFFQKALQLNDGKMPAVGGKEISFFNEKKLPCYELSFRVVSDQLPPDEKLVKEKGVLAGLKFVVRKNNNAQDNQEVSRDELVALGNFYKKVLLDSHNYGLQNHNNNLKKENEKILNRKELLESLKRHSATMVKKPKENHAVISGSFVDRFIEVRQERILKEKQKSLTLSKNVARKREGDIFHQNFL